MKHFYYIILILLLNTNLLFPQSSAIIFCVDGLDFANTIINTNFPKDKNYLQKAVSQMNLGIPQLEIVSFEWDGDAKNTDIRLKDLREVMRAYYERAQELNKKFIVISHSWGTFLAYMSLAFESQVQNPIKCDLFLTLSSPMGTYYAHELPLYTSEIAINGFVNEWLNGLKYSECNNCYPKADKWINYWAWGDLISGPLREYDSKVEDINVDETSVKFGDVKRNISTTKQWHNFTQLQPNGSNNGLIEEVKTLICSVVSCSSSDSEELTLGFILDSSGSMKNNDPKNMRKSAMKVIVDQLRGNENVFIVDFDDKATWINSNNWKNINKQSLKNSINGINSAGETDIGKGLQEMKRAIESSNISGRIGVLLLSDGLGKYNNQAEWFRQRNIPVYTISFIGKDNSELLSTIAASTNGNYLKANSDNEIITAFNQFINYLRGNAILTVYKSKISLGERLVSSFFTTSYLRYLFVTLVWRGSRIDLTLQSQDGKVYNQNSSNVEWTNGANYSFVKINNPAPGEWKAELYGADIPSGGEDFNLQVSGDTPNKIDLVDKTVKGGEIEFELSTSKGSVKLSNVKPTIKVTTPKNDTKDISENYSDGKFTYLPIEGEGDYQFDVNILANDKSGNKIQRFYKRSVFMGQFVPLYIGEVSEVMGSIIKAKLGLEIGNRPGLKCYVYKQGDTKDEKYAIGYVTYVGKDECTVEIQQYFGNTSIKKGDLVELDITYWINDSN